MMDNCKAKCSRPPKLLKSNAYQPVSNTLAGQTLIYMQMSNHYRRVENAKSIVDSGLHNHGPKSRVCGYYESPTTKNYNAPNPCEYNSTRRSNLYSASSTRTNLNDSSIYSPSPSDMDLVDQIVYDNKHKPNAFYKDANGMVYAPTSHIQCVKANDTKRKKTFTKPRAKSRSRSPAKSIKFQKPSVPMDIIDHHPKQFVPCKNFQPRILKSTAQSRVQDLSVYHPPRRRQLPQQERDPQENIWLTNSQIQLLDQVNKAETHNVRYEDPWNFQETEIKHNEVDKRPSSKGSSRSYGCDSAYCGGVSSGGGSRVSTPERSPPAKKTPPLKLELTFNEETYSNADSQDFPMSVEPARNREVEFVDSGFSGSGNQEAAYATFLRKITEDILERGIFTDRGINSIFQRHIEESKYNLDQNRMRLEVSNLRKQLGIVDEVENPYFDGARVTTPNRGTDQENTTDEMHCNADCSSGYTKQPFERTYPVNIALYQNPKNPGIEGIISDMEHCAKIDASAGESACCCPSDGKNKELGCGCEKTCTEANTFGQFFNMDRTRGGNMAYMPGNVNNLNYLVAEPNKSKYYTEPNMEMPYNDTNQINQGSPDGYENEIMFDYDVDDDATTKSPKLYAKDWRSQEGSKMSYDLMNGSKQSSSVEDELFVGDTDMEGGDSCGTAHADSLCSHIKTESSEDFLLEKLALGNLMDSESNTDRQANETEVMSISNNNSDYNQYKKSRDRSNEFPEDQFDDGSVYSTEDSEIDSENETENDGLQMKDTSDGRTVFFNRSPDRESSMEPLQDSKGNTIDRVVGLGQSSKEDLENYQTTSSRALVTFASDKNAASNSADIPGNPEIAGVNNNDRSNLDRSRRDQLPSTVKKGCFGPCKKKKVSTAPPPLKSALKARE